MRTVVFTNTFDKKAKYFLKQHPDLKPKVFKIIKLLEKDVLSPILKTHKLSGVLSGCFSCSLNFSYRITFTYDSENIYLLNIGNHDDVY